MAIDVSRFHQTFFDESLEGLDAMETGLLELEAHSQDSEAINTIFRAAHSIKGGAGTLGFGAISDFTHRLETILDRRRSGRSPVTQETIDALLNSVDCLRGMLDAAQCGDEPGTERVAEVEAELQALIDRDDTGSDDDADDCDDGVGDTDDGAGDAGEGGEQSMADESPETGAEPASDDTTGPDTPPAGGWAIAFAPTPTSSEPATTLSGFWARSPTSVPTRSWPTPHRFPSSKTSTPRPATFGGRSRYGPTTVRPSSDRLSTRSSSGSRAMPRSPSMNSSTSLQPRTTTRRHTAEPQTLV